MFPVDGTLLWYCLWTERGGIMEDWLLGAIGLVLLVAVIYLCEKGKE